MRLIASKCWATLRLMWLTGLQISLHAQLQGWVFLGCVRTIWQVKTVRCNRAK